MSNSPFTASLWCEGYGKFGRMKSSIITRSLLCFVALAVSAAHAGEGPYPSKTIRLIVPIGPGGGTDIVGRIVAQRLAEQMGVNVFVDNRPGAGTVIGTELLAKSPPDGYTLMNVAVEFTINPSLRKLPYDPIRDFVCV